MSFSLNDDELDRLFPAHIRADLEGRINGLGPSLASRTDSSAIGRPLDEVFDILRPVHLPQIQDLLHHDTRVTLGLKSNPGLRLQGVVYSKCDQVYFLLGHMPKIESSDNSTSYRFSDFAPFDGSKDLFLAAQIRKGLLNDTRELVEKLEAEKLAAETANRAKSDFLGCMSHEIRTPLNGVLGLAAILEQSGLNDMQHKLLAGISRSGKTLLALLNDIIDISRMDADQISIELVNFRLEDIEMALSDGFAALCAEKGLEFDICLPDDLTGLPLLGDDMRILQIMNNLVSNAVKFTEQGMVSVEIFPASEQSGTTHLIEFVVRDTGIGMTAEECAKIFQPFVQADTSITRRFGGTGLGLSICQRLCAMMGGEIWVQSVAGTGSSFHVRLPLEEAEVRQQASG